MADSISAWENPKNPTTAIASNGGKSVVASRARRITDAHPNTNGSRRSAISPGPKMRTIARSIHKNPSGAAWSKSSVRVRPPALRPIRFRARHMSS